MSLTRKLFFFSFLLSSPLYAARIGGSGSSSGGSSSTKLPLPPGDTNYVQISTGSLQSGGFYINQGTFSSSTNENIHTIRTNATGSNIGNLLGFYSDSGGGPNLINQFGTWNTSGNGFTLFDGSGNFQWRMVKKSFPTRMEMQIFNASGANYNAFRSSDTLAANITYILPNTGGSTGQVLTINNAQAAIGGDEAQSQLTWSTPSTSGGSSSIAVSSNSVVVSSPTSNINFLGPLIPSLIGSTTAQIVLDSSTATGVLFNSSATINFLTLSSATATYAQKLSVVSVYNATSTAGFPFGFSASTAAFSSTVNFSSNTTIVATNTASALQITANGIYGTSLGTSGGFLIDCTGGGPGSGMCGQFYTNAGAQLALGGVLNVVANNTAWNEPALYIKDASTSSQSTIRVDSGQPTFTMVDTSKVSPAGKFQWSNHNDSLRLEGRNNADNAFDSSIVILRSTGSGIFSIGAGYVVPTSTLDVVGDVAIGIGVAGITKAPLNGLLVQGNSIFQSTVNIIGIATMSTNGVSILGTTTNDNALPGNYGEFISSSTAAATATGPTDAYFQLLTITLSSGDWDVDGCIEFLRSAATMTLFFNETYISANSGTSTADRAYTKNDNDFNLGSTLLAFTSWTTCAPRVRVSTASTIPYYLKGSIGTFSAGQPTANGTIRARRVR